MQQLQQLPEPGDRCLPYAEARAAAPSLLDAQVSQGGQGRTQYFSQQRATTSISAWHCVGSWSTATRHASSLAATPRQASLSLDLVPATTGMAPVRLWSTFYLFGASLDGISWECSLGEWQAAMCPGLACFALTHAAAASCFKA